jgi:formamidopyrimidine-DNA glycosylase
VPELPDIVVYIDALKSRILGQRLDRLQLRSPFVLRSVTPSIELVNGASVRDVSRMGKRIVIALDAAAEAEQSGDLFLVIHLMIAGRLRWREPGQKLGVGPKLLLGVLEFSNGTLLFTEAGSKKRASLQLVGGRAALASLDPGGLEPLDATIDEFREALMRESHTLKRALTDPHLFSGIGNAYSDEILHAARLSPLKLTRSLSEEEVARVYSATGATLRGWVDRLARELDGRFPEKVTAFRQGMAVHGRFSQPCPVCAAPVQRIRYADNECNYCARCQTGGRLLADRSMSRLLGADRPKTIDDI